MSNHKNVQIMDELMMAITQTEAWGEMYMTDPAIQAASARFAEVTERIKSMIPLDLYEELADAEAMECSAITDAAILYGIHVADAIRDVAARPSDLSRHIIERMRAAT